MKKIERYVWEKFIGYNHDFTIQYWRCRVVFKDGTEMMIEEARPMPTKVKENYDDVY